MRVERGEVQVVLVTRVDRILRSIQTASRIYSIFKSTGAELRCLDQTIDFVTPSGELNFNILASVATMESAMLSERVKHGKAYLRQQSIPFYAPFGYKIVDSKLVLNNDIVPLPGFDNLTYADMARDLIRIFFKVGSLHGAVTHYHAKYGLFKDKSMKDDIRCQLSRTVTGFKKWLVSPVLLGHTPYKTKKDLRLLPQDQWEIHYDTHPDQALLTPQDRLSIDSILANNKHRRGFGATAERKGTAKPLSGLVRCEVCHCGHVLRTSPRVRTAPNQYYTCRNAFFKACNQNGCTKYSYIEAEVLSAIKQRLTELANAIDTLQPDTHWNATKLAELEAQYQGLVALGYNPLFENPKRALLQQIENLKLQQANSHLSLFEESSNIRAFLNTVAAIEAGTVTDAQKTELYKACLKTVWVKDKQVVNIELSI